MGVAAIGSCDKDISNIISMPLHKEVPHKNVQIGNDNQKEIPTPQNFKLIGQAQTYWSRQRAIVDDDGRRRGRTPDHSYIISSL